MRRFVLLVGALGLLGCETAAPDDWQVLGTFTGRAEATTGALVFETFTPNRDNPVIAKQLAHWDSAPALGNDNIPFNDPIEILTGWTYSVPGGCNPVIVAPCAGTEQCPDTGLQNSQYCGGVGIYNGTNPPTTLFDVALRINNTSGPVPVGGIPLGSPYVETVPPPSPFPIFWYGDIVFGAPIVYRTLTFDNATGVDFTFAGDLIHKLGENGGPELCFVAGQDLDGDNTFSEFDPDCIGWFPGVSPIGELCGNGVDDNNPPDGFTDCLDPLCALDAACN